MKLLKIKFTFVFLFCVVYYTTAQHLLTDTTSVKYISGYSEPNSDWRMIEFNDSDWNEIQGDKFFGYGDFETGQIIRIDDYGKVMTQNIESTPSLYIRTFFNVDTVNNLEELNFLCDYDDGFVAYINGVEFARINMGKQMSSTTYNQLTDRSHELEFLNDINFPVPGCYIGKAFIDSNIVEGRNVLSVEIHNDSIDGSDLGYYGILLDMTDVTYNIFDFTHRFKRIVQLDSTQLPIIVIETDEYGIPYKKDQGKWVEEPATIGIINNENGQKNKLIDEYEHFGGIDIQYRGESSSSFPKMSYDIELKDEEGQDTSVSLLGMPREADWILQGPYADKSQIRNALFYELGNKTGHWTPRVKWCEVVINGHYVGLYNLIEKIKRDSNRVNIAKLRSEEISGTDITGGYILKYDKPSSRLEVVYPKEDNLQEEQEQYIQNYVKEYEQNLYSNDGLDETKGYKKYVDELSLIDYVILAELGKNCDSYRFSTYLFKDKDDRDSRLKFGPIWDFDLTLGNSIWQEGYKTDGWQYEYSGNDVFNVERLFEDTELVNAFNERYAELRKGFLHKDSLFNRIDELVAELADPIEQNYEIWPLIDKGIFFPAYEVFTYEEEINFIKDWLSKRLIWLDENIVNIYYPVTDYPVLGTGENSLVNNFSAKVYPNPIIDDLFIDLNMPEGGQLEIELINIQGRTVSVIESTFVEQGKYKVYWKRDKLHVSPGMHIVSIKIDGQMYKHLKVLIEE